MSSPETGAPDGGADLRIFFRGVGSGLRFVIRNQGPGAAEQVALDLRPQSGKISPLVESEARARLPIERLGAGEECELTAVVTTGTGIRFEGTLEWRQPDGSAASRRALLEL